MKKKILIVLSISVLILLVLTVFYYHNIRTRNIIEKMAESKKMINILVAGSNKFNRDRHKFFAVLSINPDNSNIGFTFIPPSYRVVSNKSKNKNIRIDEIDFNDFDEIQKAFKRDLKMNIPFYIELYSLDISRIVDMIEGVNLFILDQMKDSRNINFGENYFDGKKIIRYINSTEDNSIYVKFDRIQDILFTLYYNKNRIIKFNNIEFVSEIVKSIKTNLLPHEILSIGNIINKGGSIFSIILPGKLNNNFYVSDEISYSIYEEEFLTKLVVDKDKESLIKIKIFNGTDVPGLARKMRNNLIKKGLNVVEFGTSPYKKMKNTIIISRKLDLSSIKKVSEITGIKKIYSIIDNSQLNNVLIIIGEDMTK